MSNISIKDSSDLPRKVDTFARTDGPDTVETQAVAIVDPANGNAARPDASGNLPVTMAAAPLPAGAATESTLSALSAKTPAVGQTTMSASSPVVIASNQSNVPVAVQGTVPVSGTFWQATQPVSGSVSVSNMVAQGLTDAQLRAANLPTSKNATIFQFSSQNTSSSQLAAGATFPGVVETALDQPSISLLLTSDQPITLTVRQFIDAGGTRAVPDIVFYVDSSVGFSRSFTLNGNYVQVLAQNTGASATTTFSLNTAYGDLGDSESGGIMPVTELPLVLAGAAAQTATVNNILMPTAGAASLKVASYRSASVQVVSTATGGAYIFEQSNDNVNWVALPIFNAALVTAAPITAAITPTAATIIYTIPLRCTFFRLRISTLIAGGSIRAFTRIGTEPWTATAQLIAQPTAGSLNVNAIGFISLSAGTNLAGDVGVQLRATTPGTTLVNVLAAATNNLTQLKASAGKIAGGFLTNTTASLQYVKLFSLPSASVTMGTTSATTQIALQPNATLNMAQGDFGTFLGGTGLTYAITTGSGLTDNTATTAGAVVGYVLWI